MDREEVIARTTEPLVCECGMEDKFYFHSPNVVEEYREGGRPMVQTIPVAPEPMVIRCSRCTGVVKSHLFDWRDGRWWYEPLAQTEGL